MKVSLAIPSATEARNRASVVLAAPITTLSRICADRICRYSEQGQMAVPVDTRRFSKSIVDRVRAQLEANGFRITYQYDPSMSAKFIEQRLDLHSVIEMFIYW